MSAGALVLKLGAKAIRKARLGHLEHLKIRLVGKFFFVFCVLKQNLKKESRFANRNSMSSDQISMNSQSEVVEPTLSDLEDEVCVPDTGKILSDGEEE